VITDFVLLVSSSSISPGLIDDLDARVRVHLQQYSDTFFFWAIASAIIVALGCALEGPEILHELFPKLFSFFTWPSNDRLQKFELWTKKVGMIGWVLVVLGIAAEGIFEVYDHRASGFLQTFDEILIADTQRQAAETYERAAIAMREAEEAKKDAAKLQLEVLKQGPRSTLLREHRNELIEKLRPFAGQRFTALECFESNEPEPNNAANEIISMLESGARWTNNGGTPGAEYAQSIGGPGVLVSILPNASEATRNAAKALSSALNKALLLSGVQFSDKGQWIRQALQPPTIRFDEQTVLIDVCMHPEPLTPPH